MTPFFKLSGSGNDFIGLAVPGGAPGTAVPPGPEAIRAWCRRGISVGADGLFLLRRQPDGLAMDYFNADGDPADLCLNGTRCAAQLAFHLGWCQGEARIFTPAGSFRARRLDAASVAVEVPAPPAPRPLALEAAGQVHEGWAVRVGVPHFVLPWPRESGSLDEVPIERLGPPLRRHPDLGAEGANVNFVRFPAHGRMEVRTWERGVEAETLSCGTGILAGVAVGLALGAVELPVAVLTRGGFVLEVGGGPGAAGPWTLTGDARVVAAGELLPGAALGPRSASAAGGATADPL